MNASSTMGMKIIKTKTPVRKKASQPSTTGPGHVFSKFIDRVTVRPRKTLTLPIGNTFTGSAPKGFSIGLSPGNDVDELIDMQVVSSGTPQKYEYKLVLENKGAKPINAEVWAL